MNQDELVSPSTGKVCTRRYVGCALDQLVRAQIRRASNIAQVL